jgi:hypothetical protein
VRGVADGGCPPIWHRVCSTTVARHTDPRRENASDGHRGASIHASRSRSNSHLTQRVRRLMALLDGRVVVVLGDSHALQLWCALVASILSAPSVTTAIERECLARPCTRERIRTFLVLHGPAAQLPRTTSTGADADPQRNGTSPLPPTAVRTSTVRWQLPNCAVSNGGKCGSGTHCGTLGKTGGCSVGCGIRELHQLVASSTLTPSVERPGFSVLARSAATAPPLLVLFCASRSGARPFDLSTGCPLALSALAVCWLLAVFRCGCRPLAVLSLLAAGYWPLAIGCAGRCLACRPVEARRSSRGRWIENSPLRSAVPELSALRRHEPSEHGAQPRARLTSRLPRRPPPHAPTCAAHSLILRPWRRARIGARIRETVGARSQPWIRRSRRTAVRSAVQRHARSLPLHCSLGSGGTALRA